MKLTGNRFLTVADMIDEINDDRPMMAERAAWFRRMLENAVANCEQKIRFFQQFKPSDDWPPGAIDASIKRQSAAIERYRAAQVRLSEKVPA